MFYSKSAGGFFSVEIHGNNMPDDVLEITDENYAALLAGQEQGKEIAADDNGAPILVDRPVVELTYAQKRASEYPPMTDYLDGVVKGDQAQIDKYIADCLAVKAKYPKV
jgi:hypothetical protein